VPINPIIRTRTRYYRQAYPYTWYFVCLQMQYINGQYAMAYIFNELLSAELLSLEHQGLSYTVPHPDTWKFEETRNNFVQKEDLIRIRKHFSSFLVKMLEVISEWKRNKFLFRVIEVESLTEFCVRHGWLLYLYRLKRLVAGFPPRRPGFASGQYVEFVVDKAALGQVFS
jgi:hypothetical protein